MKVTYEQIVEAMEGLSKLSKVKMPPRISRQLFSIRLLLNPSYQFFADEERKIIEQLGGKQTDGNMASFENKDKASECRSRCKELLAMEEEIDVEKIVIHDSEIGEVTPEEMWLLRNFVEWEE